MKSNSTRSILGLDHLWERNMSPEALGGGAFTWSRIQRLYDTLHAYSAADRVLINVADHCGGLRAGAADTLLRRFAQNGEDRSGLGLGLDICRRSVEANGGVLSVRDVPGHGCVFRIDLPRIS
jgi:signal transduction histidine kinase